MSQQPNDCITSLQQMNTVDFGEAFAFISKGMPMVFQCVGIAPDHSRRWATPGVSGDSTSGDVWMFLELQMEGGSVTLHQILSGRVE